MKTNLVHFIVILAMPFIVSGQNKVGIGTSTPTEKLEVAGMIYTNTGGIRFPDETVQVTAAYSMAGPENAVTAQEQPYLTIVGLADTIYVVDLSQGGMEVPAGPGGAPDGIPFIITKEIDKSTPSLSQRLTGNTNLTKVRIHFKQMPPGESVYQTIELRNAQIVNISYKNIFRTDGTYAHLESVEFVYQAIEVKYLIGPDVCHCWSFINNSSCTCD